MKITVQLGDYLREVKVARSSLAPVRLSDINSRNINDHFFLVNNGGNVRIVRWGKSTLDPRVRVPEFWTEENFHRALRNRSVGYVDKEGKNKRVPLSHYWMKLNTRHTYDGLVFDSEKEMDSATDEINLWKGFGVTEAPGDWSLMREHIADVLAAKDKASDDYIMRWIAWGFQNPTRQAEVAVALMSKEKGTGKGILGRALCRIYGGHGIQLLQRSHLVGKFNAHMAMCSFLFSDEAIWPGFKEDEAVLKGLITEPSIQVEKKGVDSFPMNNALKIMLASNSARVVPVSENDRRYAVFEVSDKRRQDHAHFDAMQKQLDHGGLGAMLCELRAMDLGGWHPREDIPETKALAHQKTQSLDPELKWLRGFLDSGVLPWHHESRFNEVKAQGLFDEARRLPGMKFWHDTDLAEFLKRWGCKRKRNNGSWWTFPPLRTMRAKWRKDMPWSDAFDGRTSEWTSSDDNPDIDFG
jgi:hypothetical protein